MQMVTPQQKLVIYANRYLIKCGESPLFSPYQLSPFQQTQEIIPFALKHRHRTLKP